MQNRQHKFTLKKGLTKKRGAKSMAAFSKKSNTMSNRIGRRVASHTCNPDVSRTIPYSPLSKTPTFCKIGRNGTSISVIGKDNKVIELSGETIDKLNNAVKSLKISAKIPVYGLSRAEMGTLITGITNGTNKRVSVYANPVKNSHSNCANSYLILLQEGDK